MFAVEEAVSSSKMAINSEYGMKYLLDMTQLQQGDIVLEDGETKFASKIIKKVTKSKYSHAMIYIDHSLIHAIPKGGVFSKNPQRILKANESSFKVLRSKNPLSELVLKQICDNASAKVGSLYSNSEAGKAILPNNKEGKNRKQFCSRLVAQSYYETGIKIVDDVNYCTPEDINQSPLLEEVEGCVRQATDVDIEMTERRDPNLENQEETLKWLELARNLLKREKIDVQTINDISEHLFKDKSSDKRICKYIESTKYLELYNVDRGLNSYRYCENEFNTHFESLIEENKALSQELELNRREIERHGKNLKIAKENYRTSKLKYCKLHVKLYRNLLKENEHRLKVILKYTRLDQSSTNVINKYLSELSSLLR